MLRVERQGSLEPEYPVGHQEGYAGERDDRGAIPLPRLLALGIDADDAIDRPLDDGEPPGPPLVYRHHVGAEEAPGDRHHDDQSPNGPGEIHQNHSALNSETPRKMKTALDRA